MSNFAEHNDSHPPRGARVIVTLTSGRQRAGTVVSFPGQWLMVHFVDGYERDLAHPSWRIEDTKHVAAVRAEIRQATKTEETSA